MPGLGATADRQSQAQWTVCVGGEDGLALRGLSYLKHSASLWGLPNTLLPTSPHSFTPPQVIGLLDVFTPDETLDDFTDL